MIIKGKSRGNGIQLGQYVITPLENERVEIIEIRGVAADNVPGAVVEMDALAAGTRCDKPLYHASINTRTSERLTDEQRMRAIDRLEAELGFTGQPRVVVVHEKKGREHCHIVWARIEIEKMRAISDSFNYRKHETVARELEREFGHERVQGAHVEREGRPRPQRTPSHAETQQADRTGISPQQVKDQVTALWRSTDNGQSFAAALKDAGYVLARGDRRDFVIIDPMGGTHSLARRIEGARVKDIRERLTGIDRDALPTVAEGRVIQQHGRVNEAEIIRRDEEARSKRPSAENQDWTNHAGMVEQQHSAMEWIRKSQKQSPEPDRGERVQKIDDAEQSRQQRRQDLLREFGRELSEEESRDLGPGRERTWR